MTTPSKAVREQIYGIVHKSANDFANPKEDSYSALMNATDKLEALITTTRNQDREALRAKLPEKEDCGTTNAVHEAYDKGFNAALDQVIAILEDNK